MHNAHPEGFLRVVHETNEYVGEEIEPFPNPSANDLCPSIVGGDQHSGVYDRRKNAIESIYALEKDVGILSILCGIEKVNEKV